MWTNQSLEILVVYLINDNTNLHDLNITPQFTKIDTFISMWILWGMTAYGNITIVEICLISQCINKLNALPTVEVNTKKLQNKLDHFV